MEETISKEYSTGQECPEQAKQMSTAALAFVGDAVFGLMVREFLCRKSRLPVGRLHRMSVDMVRSEGQARAAALLLPTLTEEELGYFTRGRNTHNTNIPKNSSVADYRAATGLETLFGYLHLCGRTERLQELFEKIINNQPEIR